MWDNDCEQAFFVLKKFWFSHHPKHILRDGHFVLSTYVSDTGMGAVLEQEQQGDGRVGNRVIVYASKSQHSPAMILYHQ